ncbi:MAG: DUF1549 domain-containing protein [Isosphaeraceae bacterium]
MASFRKRGKTWFIRYTDADGVKREQKGCPDKRATEQLARDLEIEAAKARSGFTDPRDVAYAKHAALPLGDHLRDFKAYLIGKGDTNRHGNLHSGRAERLAALACGANLAEIDPLKTATLADRKRAETIRNRTLATGWLASLSLSRVQEGLAILRASGRSLQTLNHHRAAIRTFVLWARKDGRLRDDPLMALASFNAKEDPRHERRTIGEAELQTLMDAAHSGPPFREMTGPERALAYQLAVASGLRFSELASIRPGSFDFGPSPSVTILAGFAKNGQTATLPLPTDLADDLALFVATLPSNSTEPVFRLPPNDGAEMLRFDLERCGIPYRDTSGRVFDFHALRCMLATLADSAGVSPRIVQRLMRHSKLEMTDRYTRPRLSDLEGATDALPTFRPSEPTNTQAAKTTGTDGQHIKNVLAHHLPTGEPGTGQNLSDAGVNLLSDDVILMDRKSLGSSEVSVSSRALSSSVASDRGGARTHDQRINVPHRLSPTTRGPGVAGLDSPTAVTGVPRRVSEAGPGDPVGALPADCPIPHLFKTVTLAVTSYVVVARALQGVPANCGIHSSRFGFFPREAPIFMRRRSPLLYRLSYPVKGYEPASQSRQGPRLSNSLRTRSPRAKPAPPVLDRYFSSTGFEIRLSCKNYSTRGLPAYHCEDRVCGMSSNCVSQMRVLKRMDRCHLDPTRIVKEAGPMVRRLSSTWLVMAGMLVWIGLGLLNPAIQADEATSKSLAITPAKALLRGPDAVQQLAVAARDGHDLTSEVQYTSADPKVATVEPTGLISAAGDGSTTIQVRQGDLEARIEVTVQQFADGPPMNFANQVVPILTKLGCNSGGCHGKANGQNGFKISLLGFEPQVDYDALVKEARGRRVFPAAPERSLLLQKATAQVPHGGGRRLEPGSHEYRVIARWIGAGMPLGKPDDPTVARIEVSPTARVLDHSATQQLVVTAHYTDGSTEDVTRWAQYQSNEIDVASVGDAGRVEARTLAGQAAVMARYQSQVAVFRATVPTGVPIPTYPEFPAVNIIDTLALKQWKPLGIAPSELCTDAEFLRRASLDVIGTLPTAEEVRAFVADPDPGKRAKQIDRLLDRPEYAAYFATRWADILRNKRENNPLFQNSTYRFHNWIRRNLARNLPYDQFARQVLAASGTPETAPPVAWYRRLKTADAFVDDTAQVFLGMRLQCAKCHHHPFEKWSEDDYYGFAAFFARVGRKPSAASSRAGRLEEAIFTAKTGAVTQPKTGKVMEPKGLGDAVVPIAITEDPRSKLVDWLADPQNPYFAKAVVNRYWAHFFGRGIVEPIDDMRVTNPPSNPELLDALAADFIQSGYDLKHLVRMLCTSRTYGLSSIPTESNAKDNQSFARRYPRRMSAEVLLDAIAQVSGVPTVFAGLPPGTRAIDLPDESVVSKFLDTFGRPKRDTACECERVTDASLSQSLMLLNSDELQAKLATPTGRAAELAKDPRPDLEKFNDLFWLAFARPPSSSETGTALAHLEAHKDKRPQAFEDILWALINAKEFQFND